MKVTGDGVAAAVDRGGIAGAAAIAGVNYDITVLRYRYYTELW